MICNRASEFFSDYCDGSLDATMAVPFEAHLAECASCNKQLADFKIIWGAVEKMPIIEAPHDFRASVWRKIDAQESAKPEQAKGIFANFNLAKLFKPALALGACAVLFFVFAPVVIPGTFNKAGLGFNFFGNGSSNHSSAYLTVNEPKVEVMDGKNWLNVPINNVNKDAISVDVDVTGDGVEKPAVRIEAPANSNNMYHLTPLSSNYGKLTLKLSWNSGGTINSKVYIINGK